MAKENSIIRIRNTDEICLARVLAVSISKIEKDSRYRHDKGVLANFCRLHIVLRILSWTSLVVAQRVFPCVAVYEY